MVTAGAGGAASRTGGLCLQGERGSGGRTRLGRGQRPTALTWCEVTEHRRDGGLPALLHFGCPAPCHTLSPAPVSARQPDSSIRTQELSVLLLMQGPVSHSTVCRGMRAGTPGVCCQIPWRTSWVYCGLMPPSKAMRGCWAPDLHTVLASE